MRLTGRVIALCSLMISCAMARVHVYRNTKSAEAEKCLTDKKDCAPVDQFETNIGGIYSRVRVPWNDARIWLIVVVPLFGLIQDEYKGPLIFKVTNLRQGEVQLNMCNVRLFRNAEGGEANVLPPVKSCAENKTIPFKRFETVDFSENYQEASVGDVKLIELKFLDAISREEIAQRILIEDEWQWDMGANNK